MIVATIGSGTREDHRARDERASIVARGTPPVSLASATKAARSGGD